MDSHKELNRRTTLRNLISQLSQMIIRSSSFESGIASSEHNVNEEMKTEPTTEQLNKDTLVNNGGKEKKTDDSESMSMANNVGSESQISDYHQQLFPLALEYYDSRDDITYYTPEKMRSPSLQNFYTGSSTSVPAFEFFAEIADNQSIHEPESEGACALNDEVDMPSTSKCTKFNRPPESYYEQVYNANREYEEEDYLPVEHAVQKKFKNDFDCQPDKATLEIETRSLQRLVEVTCSYSQGSWSISSQYNPSASYSKAKPSKANFDLSKVLLSSNDEISGISSLSLSSMDISINMPTTSKCCTKESPTSNEKSTNEQKVLVDKERQVKQGAVKKHLYVGGPSLKQNDSENKSGFSSDDDE